MRFLDDARYAFRFLAKMLRTALGSTIVTILTLALAISANTSVFAVINAVLFKNIPGISEPQQLVNIMRMSRGSRFESISYPDYLDYRDRNSVFSGVAAYSVAPLELGLRAGGAAERVSALLVTENLFEVLGATPALGRFFTAAENQPASPPAAVISYGLWKERFDGDIAIVNKEIVLNGQPVSVVGIAPEGFHGPDLRQIDVWLPAAARNTIARPEIVSVDVMGMRGAMWLGGIARLKAGVSIAQARSELTVIAAQLESAYPDTNRNKGADLIPYFAAPGLYGSLQWFLTALLAIVALVLLIACANIAGIGLARAAARKREVALRLALGAGRVRIITQMLAETLVLFLVAGVAGMLIASWISELLYGLRAELPSTVAIDLTPDVRVVLFTVGTTLVAALAAGLTPALAASRTDLATTLKEESLTSTGRRSRLRRALVIAQVSLSLVLLVAGALFIRTLTRTDLTRPGFEPNGVHVVSLDFFMAGFDEAEGRRFAAAMLNRVAPLPGVESASLAHDLPLDLNAFSLDDITLDGKTGPDGTSSFTSEWNIVSPGFFRTIRLPLLRGRDFTEADSAGAPAVAIINQTMAERFWPGDDPVGKRFYRGPAVSDNVIEVIGVAANTDNRVVGGRPIPFIYVPLNQTYIPRNSLLVRSNNQADAIPLVRNVLREMNPNLPVIRVRSLNQVIGFSLLPQRVAASIIGSMGLVGLLLASIGIYAVTAHAVSSRIREIGIRVALGARPQRVVRLMLREGLMLAAAGLVLGLIGAVAAGQIVRSYLYSIGPTDLIAFAGATITLVTVVLLASYIPAHRATKVDAMAALRHK